jgi:hypothetical protein
MGREESGGSSACHNSNEGRASEGQHYAGGPRTPRRGDEATLGRKTYGSTGQETGPESSLKLMRRAAFIDF